MMKIKGRTLAYWRSRVLKWFRCLVYGNQYYIFVPVVVNGDRYISTLRNGGFQTENDAAFLAVCEAVEHARYYFLDQNLSKIKGKPQFKEFQTLCDQRKFLEAMILWNQYFSLIYGRTYNVLSIGFNRTEFKEHYDTNLSFQELIAD